MIENPMYLADMDVLDACDCGHGVEKGDTILKWNDKTFCDLACLVDYIKLEVEELEV